MAEGNGWDEYRKLVMTEITRLTSEIRHERNNAHTVQHYMFDRMTEMEKELAMLKVRCGIWGLMGGLIPAVSALVISGIR